MFMQASMPLVGQAHFVYYRSMNVVDLNVVQIAAAIGEPARARMLFCLMDGHARTSTELAVVAGVSPSTASVHLQKLRDTELLKVAVQGKHRYYCLAGEAVAHALEGLSVLAGGTRMVFEPKTPNRLRAARTCYDHLAGALGVALHDRVQHLHWLSDVYELTAVGRIGFVKLGLDLSAIEAQRRRRFAYACLDWSERRPHLGGALGAALLRLILQRRWVEQDADSRAVSITRIGKRELLSRLGVAL